MPRAIIDNRETKLVDHINVVAEIGLVTTRSRLCHGLVTAEFEKKPSKSAFVTTSPDLRFADN